MLSGAMGLVAILATGGEVFRDEGSLAGNGDSMGPVSDPLAQPPDSGWWHSLWYDLVDLLHPPVRWCLDNPVWVLLIIGVLTVVLVAACHTRRSLQTLNQQRAAS